MFEEWIFFAGEIFVLVFTVSVRYPVEIGSPLVSGLTISKALLFGARIPLLSSCCTAAQKNAIYETNALQANPST